MQSLTDNLTYAHHKVIFDEILINIEVVVKRKFQHLPQKQLTTRVLRIKKSLKIFMDFCNRDLQKNPIEAFYVDDFEQLISTIYTEQNLSLGLGTCRLHKGDARFINDEIIVLYGTKQWLKTPPHFDENANAITRFKLCIDHLISAYKLDPKKKRNERKFTIAANLINKACGQPVISSSILMAYYKGLTNLPIFIREIRPDKTLLGASYKSYEIIETLEKISHAPAGYLTSVIPVVELDPQDVKSKVGWNKRVSNERLDFSLISQRLKNEIYLYAKYKTDLFIDKKRNETWVIRDEEKEPKPRTILDSIQVSDLYVLYKDKYVPTLEIFICNLTYILRHSLRIGLLKKEELTLFNLCQAKVSKGIINDLVIQGESLKANLKVIVQTLSAMWHPEHSFFCEYKEDLCPELDEDEIYQIAIDNFEALQQVKGAIADKIVRSKHSTKNLNQKITDLNDPSSYVLNALKKAHSVFELLLSYEDQRSGRGLFVLSRDICLISCLLEIPLRVRNWSNMKIGYHPDCECLYKSNNDLYVVSVPKSCFKNFNQRIIPDVFTHTLSPTTSKYLDEYLEKYRKLSPFSKESEYFFLTYYKPHATTKSLSRTLKYFFSNYGDQTLRKGGINIHFIRDIVATTYLKIHPASFLQVGMLLLDSEVTVKMNYGHLKPKDVLRNWQDHIETMKNKGD